MSNIKQISLALPKVLYEESKEYSEEYGYKTIQELILDLLRRKVIIENTERYQKIEFEMKKSGKKINQKQAAKYLNKLW